MDTADHRGSGPRTPRRVAPPRASDAARRSDPARGTAPRGARPAPLVLVALAVVAIALALGLMGRITDHGAFVGSAEFSRLGGPWLIGGYVAGALCGWRRGPGGLVLGVGGGAVALALGSLAYYGISIWFELGTDVHRAARLGVGWAAAGLVVGGAAGGLGALLAPGRGGRARPWLQGASIGTLGGLLMGESIALLWVWEGEALRTMATLEGLGGAALVVVAAVGRSWRWILASVLAAAVTATIAPIATTLVREALRQIGWAGA